MGWSRDRESGWKELESALGSPPCWQVERAQMVPQSQEVEHGEAEETRQQHQPMVAPGGRDDVLWPQCPWPHDMA